MHWIFGECKKFCVTSPAGDKLERSISMEGAGYGISTIRKPVIRSKQSSVQDKLKDVKTLSDLTDPGGPVRELLKQAVEKILKGEQEEHLGYEPYKKKLSTQPTAGTATLSAAIRDLSLAVTHDLRRIKEIIHAVTDHALR